MKIIWIAVVLLMVSGASLGEDARERFAGKSGCQPELRWAPGTYSIRLDKSRRTRLSAYTVGRQNLLFIIQYADGQDRCGIIRDFVKPKDASSSFVWDCWDLETPKRSSWVRGRRSTPGSTARQWRPGRPAAEGYVSFHLPASQGAPLDLAQEMTTEGISSPLRRSVASAAANDEPIGSSTISVEFCARTAQS